MVLITWECFHYCWAVFAQYECLFCSSFSQQMCWGCTGCLEVMRLGQLTPPNVLHIPRDAMLSRQSWGVGDDGDCWMSGTGWTWISRSWAIFFSSIICFSRFLCFLLLALPSLPTLPYKKVLICLYLNPWTFSLLTFCIVSHHMERKSGCVVLSYILGLKCNSSLYMASHC